MMLFLFTRLCSALVFFFFKQKTAYEMRISDWSSDVCSSDLGWKEVAVVRAETSQLTFVSGDGDRVASILITRSTLYGCKIDMTVSPSSAASGLSGGAAPRTPVQRR